MDEWVLTEYRWLNNSTDTMRLHLVAPTGDGIAVEIQAGDFQRELARLAEPDGYEELIADITSLLQEAVLTTTPGTKDFIVLPPY